MSRKAEESIEKPPAKRARLGGPKQDDALTFNDLIPDVLANVLSFLTREEMDNVSVLSKRLAEARNHPSLDQTRTATIVCRSERMIDFLEAIASKGWAADVFAANSNKKHLKVEGLERLQRPTSEQHTRTIARAKQADIHLQSFIRLDMSALPNTRNRPEMSSDNIAHIVRILPNLQEVDLSYVDTGGMALIYLRTLCPRLTCFKWNGCNKVKVPATEHVNNIIELYLDSSRMESWSSRIFSTDMEDQEHYLWRYCPRLERLSMKNATYSMDDGEEEQPVSQDMLIKLVRLHPTLRWLRSDLTDENIAMLKREKPDVTLLNE